MPLNRYDDSYVDDPSRKMQFFEDFDDSETQLLDWLIYWLSGDRKQDRLADQNRYASEEQHELEYEYQKNAAAEMPSFQMQGLLDSGINLGAAAAALSGGSSVQSPSFSSSGSSSMPPQNMLNGIMDLIPSLLQQRLVNAQSRRLDAQTDLDERRLGMDIVLSWTNIQKMQKEIVKIGHDMDMDEENIKVAQFIAQTQRDKTVADVKKIHTEIRKIGADMFKTFAETNLINNQAAHELIKMTLTKSQKSYWDQATVTSAAQADTYRTQSLLNVQSTYESESRTNLNNAQTTGQNLENQQKELEVYIKDQRMKVSEVLGFEVDAPEVTQILEAMVDGDINAILGAIEDAQSGIAPSMNRYLQNAFPRSGSYLNSRSSGRVTHWYPRR